FANRVRGIPDPVIQQPREFVARDGAEAGPRSAEPSRERRGHIAERHSAHYVGAIALGARPSVVVRVQGGGGGVERGRERETMTHENRPLIGIEISFVY